MVLELFNKDVYNEVTKELNYGAPVVNYAKSLSNVFLGFGFLSSAITLCSMSFCRNTKESPKKIDDCLQKSTELYETTVPELKVYGYFNTKSLRVEKTLTVFGTLKGEQIFCEELIVHGKAEIQTLQANTAVLFGSVTGKHFTVSKNLTVNGSADLQDIHVPEKTILFGGIKIKDGKLANVEISTNLATFLGTTIESLVIKKDHSGKKQIIELWQGSTISGDVTFEGGNGEIHLSDNSKILGQVSGAKVVVKS